MRIRIECDDLMGVISRVLDQIRRLGIDVEAVSGTRDGAQGHVELQLRDVEGAISVTLRERILQIGGVASVGVCNSPREPSFPLFGRGR